MGNFHFREVNFGNNLFWILHAVFGQTLDGRYLTVIFELKSKGIARPITGWDMSRAELRNYKKHRE